MPSSQGPTTASMSPKHHSVSAALTRTKPLQGRGRCNAATAAARAAGFPATATASSRSRIAASAPAWNTFSAMRAWLAGANRKLRHGPVERVFTPLPHIAVMPPSMVRFLPVM